MKPKEGEEQVELIVQDKTCFESTIGRLQVSDDGIQV